MADPTGPAAPDRSDPVHPAPPEAAPPVDRQETVVHPTEHPTTEHPSTEFPTTEHPTTAIGTGHPAGTQATAVQPPTGGPSAWATWQDPAPGGVTVEPAAPPRPGRRSPDLVALVAGGLFVLVAVLALVGTSLPGWVFGGGLVATVLVVLGAGLLVSELRRVKR